MLAAAVLCLTMLLLAGCGKTEVTMQQILDANSNEALLEKSDRILITRTTSDGEIIVYRTADFRGHTNDGVYYEGYLEGHYYCCYDGVYFAAVNCYDAPFNPLEESIAFDEELSLEETILETETDGSNLRVKTSAPPENSQATLEKLGIAYTEGDSVTYEYLLDAETLLLLEDTMTITHADGSLLEERKTTLTLDAEMPEIIQQLYDRLTSEDYLDVTIVLDPGTDAEKTYHCRFVQGEDMDAYLPDGYTTLYKDAACTQVYGSNDEGIVYVKDPGTLYSVQD